jgi:hypothetical protein
VWQLPGIRRGQVALSLPAAGQGDASSGDPRRVKAVSYLALKGKRRPSGTGKGVRATRGINAGGKPPTEATPAVPAACLAFPYHQDAPSSFPERPSRLRVTLDIASELRMPILGSAARSLGQRAAGMLMPEASVDLDHHPVARKHDVRGPRQVGSMQPEAFAH